jgi:hypothetical protein
LSFQLGLTHRESEAEDVFEYFSKGRPPLLYVDDLLQALIPKLSPKRLAVVHQAWRALDWQGEGVVTVRDLVDHINLLGHPDVSSGRRTIDACRRELLEYFGASNEIIFPNSEFTLEEAISGRRKPPIGSLTTPLCTPAGKPSMAKGAVRRGVNDVRDEVSVHPPKSKIDHQVTVSDFEGYYESASLFVEDDDEFEAQMRETWRVMEPGGLAHDASHHGFVIEFEDGSRGLMKLRNDRGLADTTGAAGFSTGVFWAMGPEVTDEVKRRLEAQCGRKIKKFTWA